MSGGVRGSYEEYSNAESFGKYILRHPNRLCHTHTFPPPKLFQSLQDSGIKMIAMLRDPRDQLISLIFFEHFTRNYKQNSYVVFPDPNEPLTTTDVQYLLDLILTDDLWPYENGAHISLFQRQDILPYLHDEYTHVIRFEDLVGEKGGGTYRKQKEVIEHLISFLDIRGDIDIERVIKQSFGNTWTFRSGQINQWKKYFSDQHLKEFKKRFGYVLEHCGYDD